MNDTTRRQLDAELADALSADDVAAALDALARRYAGDPDAIDAVGETRRIVADLAAVRQALDAAEAPPMGRAALPAGIRWRWIVHAAAAGVAAAIAIAVYVSRTGAPPSSAPVLAVASKPAEAPLGWRLPEVRTLSLSGETFRVPALAVPVQVAMPSAALGWTVPTIPAATSEQATPDNDT